MPTGLHPRRWLRFSLRSLLLVTTVIALFTARWVNRARDQQAAIAGLKRHYPGCIAQYDYEFEQEAKTGLMLSATAPRLPMPFSLKAQRESDHWAPHFLRQRLGPDFFFNLATIITPEDAREPLNAKVRSALARVSSLRRVGIYPPVTDADVEALSNSTDIQILRLAHSTELTDASLRAIAQLDQLEYLSLGWGRFTPGGVAKLGRLRHLRTLSFTEDSSECPCLDCELTDEHLEVIANFENLQKLMVRSTKISDAGLAKLGRLHKLKFLFVAARTPNGAGFSEFHSMDELNTLYLELPRADTETLIEHLRGLPKLKLLMPGCGTLERWQEALPGVRIQIY